MHANKACLCDVLNAEARTDRKQVTKARVTPSYQNQAGAITIMPCHAQRVHHDHFVGMLKKMIWETRNRANPKADPSYNSNPPNKELRFSKPRYEQELARTSTHLQRAIRTSHPKKDSRNIGTLIVRRGFWGQLYTLLTIRSPRNKAGNYLGPYITF